MPLVTDPSSCQHACASSLVVLLVHGAAALGAHVQLAEHLLVGEVLEPLGPLADLAVGQTGGQAVDVLKRVGLLLLLLLLLLLHI